jgi:HAD superfamily hydrolase (TIGR01484 family)
LIVTDLDYTFLGAKGSIVPRNLEAVARFRAQGGKFTVATGRRLFDVKRAIPDLEKIVNAPAILANGSILYDVVQDVEIDSGVMDFERAYEAVKYLRKELPHLGIRITTDTTVLTDFVSPMLSKDCPPDQPWRYRVLPLREFKPEKWYKVVCRAKAEETEQFKRLFLEKYGDEYNWCHSEKTIFEFQKKGYNKGVYIERLRQYYRECGQDVKIYVCGDYENDFEMLRAADVAVCPDNAIGTVKEICDLCLCDHKQGVIADLIEHIEREIKEGKCGI